MSSNKDLQDNSQNGKQIHKYNKNDLFPFYESSQKKNNKNYKTKNIDNSPNIFSRRKKPKKTDEANSSITSQDLCNIEKQLESTNKKFEISFKEKLYENILKDIESKEDLLNIKSVESFNLYIMKIRCMIKTLKSKFESVLKSKLEPKNYFEVDSLIISVKNEFQNLSLLFMCDNKYEYEKATQTYCKFLLVLSTIGYYRDEYFQSMTYIILGIKMMKILFVRQQIALDIKTYDTFIKLLIVLLNRLLEDNNFNEVLLYSSYLFKILEISFKYMIKNNIDTKYHSKFSKYVGFNYAFVGYCFEQTNNYYIALESYKEACYFFNKAQKKNIFGLRMCKMIVEDECENVVIILKDKLKKKIIFEEMERQRKYEQMEKRKKELIEEALRKEKNFNLKLIASGISAKSVDKFNNIQNMLYSDVLTPYNQRLIERYDTELMLFVYNEKNKNKKEDKSKKKDKNKKLIKKNQTDNNLPSFTTKSNLSHYKIYSKLMSKEYKEFLMKNKILEFNYPQNEKDILDKLQGYLNRKMAIDVNSTTYDKKNSSKKLHFLKKNTSKYTNTESNFSHKSKNYNINNYKVVFNENNSYDPTDDDDNHKQKCNLKSAERNTNKHQRVSSQFILTSNLKSSKEKPKVFPQIKTNRNPHVNSGKLGGNEFDKHKIDKYILSHNYLGKIAYLDTLASKELSFQKTFLNIKNNNSKLYLNSFSNEINGGGRISKEEIYKSFIRIQDKATDVEHNYELEMQRDKEIKNQPKVIGQIFKSVGNATEQGKEMKSFTSLVFSRYIREGKKNKTLRANKEVKKDYVKKVNEDALLKLNNNIKEINYLLKIKKEESKNKNEKSK